MSDIFFQERVSVDVLHIYAHFYIFGECHAAAYILRKKSDLLYGEGYIGN